VDLRLLRPIAGATRESYEQVAEHRDRVALGLSKSSAGPPALSTRSQTSVISSFGSTSARTRFSPPRALERRQKIPRKSRYDHL